MNRIAPVILIGLIFWLLWPKPVDNRPDAPLPEGWSHFCRGDQIRGLVQRGEEVFVGGLSGLKKTTWRNDAEPQEIETPADFNLVRIEAMLVDASGTIWIGHETGLLSYSVVGNWSDHTANLPDPKVLSLCLDKDNSLWVGTWRGAAKLDTSGVWSHFKVEDGLPAERIRTIFCDSEGGLWFGTSNFPEGGLVRWFAGKKTFYDTKNLLAHPHVTAMMEDSSGQIWVGTGFFDKGGVTIFPDWKNDETAQKKILDQSSGLAGNKGRSLFQDREGIIWVGSELDGLTRIDIEGRFKIIKPSDGLVGDEIMAILQDPDGNLWLGQELGLCRIASHALELLAAAR